MTFDKSISLCVGFKVIDGFLEWYACFACDLLGNSITELRMGVNAGTNGSATDWKFQNSL